MPGIPVSSAGYASSEQECSPGRRLAPKRSSMPSSSHAHEETSSSSISSVSSYSSPSSSPNSIAVKHSTLQPSFFWQEEDLLNMFDAATGQSHIKYSERARTALACVRGKLDDRAVVQKLQLWANHRFTMGSPGRDQVLVLIKLNVFRALMCNSITLGIPSDVIMEDDAISTFFPQTVSVSRILTLPKDLRPTESQTRVTHHPWIDCLPVPQMRENLIHAGDTFDDMQLCGDLIGLFSTGTGRTGIVVWGEPWEVAGWEVTEEFLKFWGWTIKGCWDLFESTNRWRRERGDQELCFDEYGM
ncbi:hypothetical protein VTL71DRAFT_2518 [Oculimacula yallundae]|uniref:Uncharacterized protein n=1 Tax=Oculimacula yallundae TaxID=86028 RepID=A0ABR4C9V0_9HELO